MLAKPIWNISLRSMLGPALLIAMVAGAVPAGAQPTLRVRAEQRQQPARLSLSPIQLWDTEWWLLAEATPDGAALARIEYRTRFLDDRPQSLAGGVDLAQTVAEPLGGRIAITLPTRDDYQRRFEVRARVTDTTGASSDWISVAFPPDKTIRPGSESPYTVSAQPDADRKYDIVGTVEYEASDSTPLRVVRDELGRQARAAGGDAAVGVRLARSSEDSFVFAADAIRYVEAPLPTPTPVTLATDRKLGEIVVSYERR